MKKLRKLIVCVGAAAPLFGAKGVLGQVFTWTGPESGSFSDAGNWSSGTVPGNFADIMIDGGAAQNSAVSFNIATSIRNLQISAGDAALVNDGVVLTFGPSLSSSISGPGTITLGQSVGAQIAAQGSLTLSGGGVMNLSGFSQLNVSSTLRQQDFTIAGTGAMNPLFYENSANGRTRAMAAIGATGLFATLFINSSEINNAGTFSAAAASTLSIAATRLDTAGTLLAESGGTVLLARDMVLNNGTFASQPGGLAIAPSFPSNDRITLNNMANTGDFRTERARNIVAGQLFNSGTFTLATTGASIELSGASTTFSGGGTLRLTDSRIAGAATSTLVNQSNVRGFHNENAINVGTLVNSGTIEADVAGRQLVIAAEQAAADSGVFAAANGGELVIGGAFSTLDNRFGRIVARGPGSRVSINRPLRIFAGFIDSDSTGEVIFDAPGTLTLDNVTNIGRLRLNGGTLAGDASGAIINSGTITASSTITLAGTTTLLGSGQFNANSRISYYGIINQSNRIGGNGEIEGLDNRANGIVDAAGTQLSLVGTTKNSGLMRASAGGTLLIPTINNTGGRIESAAGSHVAVTSVSSGTLAALAGGTISGQFGSGATLLGPGTFANSSNGSNLYSLAGGTSISIGQSPILDGGRFAITGSTTISFVGGPQTITLKDIALNAGAATLNFGPGTLNLQGAVVNRVNLNLISDANFRSRLMPIGVATLSGGGTIHGGGGTLGGGRLVNLDNTIYLDAEFFGLWNNGWENYADLRAKGSSSFLNFRSTGTQSINRGTIFAASDGRLDIAGVGTASIPPTLDNTGGRILAATSSTTVITNAFISGGILDGTQGQIVAGATAGIGPETFDPPARTRFRDVTIVGQGVGTGAGKVRTESFITLPAGAMFTVGDPDLDGGHLQPTSSTWTGGGEIRVLPRGAITGGGQMVLGDVTIFGAGDLGRGQTDFLIEANSAIIARSLPAFPEDNALDLQLYHQSTNRGRLQIDEQAHMRLTVGTISFGTLFGTGSIVVNGGGTLSSEIEVNQSKLINDGTTRLPRRAMNVQSVTGTGEIHLSALGSLNADFIKQQSLSIVDNTVASIRSPVQASRVGELSIGTLSRLRVTSTTLIVDYNSSSPFDVVRQLITRGYAGGSFNGTGIVGFVSGTRNTSLGYAEATDVNLNGSVLMMELLDSTSVIVRATFAGDADLNGAVNIADFSRLAANFNSPAIWSSGDFNYDGVANISDFSLMASNFNLSLAVELPRSAVPEPSAFGAIAFAWAMARRRRMIQRD